MNNIGREYCRIETIYDKRVIVFSHDGRKTILLAKAVTYLGNPHPLFKKRVQFPLWFKTFAQQVQTSHANYEIKLLGVYHYENNVIFVDFSKDTYLLKTMHNSSAHVYVNDLYQGMRYGIFRKTDAMGNEIVTLQCTHLHAYLIGNSSMMPSLFDLFRQFNNGFTFGQWLYAVDQIKEMYGAGWKHWKQTEWAGWFLEYKFDAFVRENHLESSIQYVGSSHKTHDADLFDFDLWFGHEQFYGDLKASDMCQRFAIGNDQNTFVECINRYDRFWYVIYEHQTKKDGTDTTCQATRERDAFLREVGEEVKPHAANHRYIKHSVNFKKMEVIELNRINYREVLSAFNQGRQPSGAVRNEKFRIDKNNIENFIVFRYTYE